MEEKKSSLLHKISKVISDFFNPLVSLVIFFIYMSIKQYTLKDSLLYFVPVLLMIIVPTVISYLIFHYIRNGYIDLVMLFILILLFSLQISNLFIKSSMHTAFNVFVAALFFSLDWKMGLAWLGVAILVGITRIILKRHTVREVFMGAGIAFMVSFIYLYCNIQFQH